MGKYSSTLARGVSTSNNHGHEYMPMPHTRPISVSTMPQQRYKLTLAYRGTRYHGWQKQLAVETYKGPTPAEGEGIPTVQETLAKAMMLVLRHPILIVGSSRTDSGVHAKAQVAHFDSDQTQIPTDGLRLAINHALPNDMVVRAIEPMPEDFDAIKWTISKR